MRMSKSRLMGALEIRIALDGPSRQRAYQITGKPTFPRPVADLAAGKVWAADEVASWIAAHRQPVTDTDVE